MTTITKKTIKILMLNLILKRTETAILKMYVQYVITLKAAKTQYVKLNTKDNVSVTRTIK